MGNLPLFDLISHRECNFKYFVKIEAIFPKIGKKKNVKKKYFFFNPLKVFKEI